YVPAYSGFSCHPTKNIFLYFRPLFAVTCTKRRIAGFEALTGAKVNLTGVPFQNLYNILQKNWSSSASKYDMAIILPSWQIEN
ncbi:MAG: hypothetical protein V7L05_28940, partial [Nostoc sp.]|uniref:hypothetical protein n=1 Tax=Nostoc sp. TaxID=1180 RepID=UPI002FF48C18